MFFVVALIIMIIVITSIYYIFLNYAPEIIMQYSGYAIQGKVMVNNLKSNNITEVDKYIDLVEIKEQDLIYKKLNTYYVGEKEKTEIDVKYPIYVNELNTILNISPNTKLITINYEEVEGYPEFLLTGGIMYNGDDLTRTDGNEYIFLKTEEDIYTNVEEIEIKTEYNTYKISKNSNIYFTEKNISYYEIKDISLVYNNIDPVLNKNGKLENIKEEIKYPKNFLNDNIEQIAQNETSEKIEVIIYYKTGKVLVFNYVTGETIYENTIKNDISLFNFVRNSFQNAFSNNEEKEKQYEESKKLVKKLEDTPIEKAIKAIENNNINDTETNKTEKNNYITIYNSEAERYDVYKEEEIIEGTKEEPISETEKISENSSLKKFYSYNPKTGSPNNVNGIIIIIVSIIVIMILLSMLRIYIYSKNNNKK